MKEGNKMIYLFKNPLGNVSIIFNGEDLTEEEKAQAWAVDSIPEPEKKTGKYAALNFNEEKEEIWYEYENIPKDNLEERLEATETALLNLILEGGGL